MDRTRDGGVFQDLTEFGPALPAEPVDLPEILPILPLRDVVLFPYIIVPLSVSRARSIRAVEMALATHRAVLLLAQRDPALDDPGWDGLYRVGTVATVMRVLKLPDDRVRVLVQGVSRARLDYPTEEGAFLQGKVSLLAEEPARESLEAMALVRAVHAGLERAVALGKAIPAEVLVIAGNLEDPGRLADLAAANLDIGVEAAQELLEIDDPNRRLHRVMGFLQRETELLEMQNQITTQARSAIDRSQRDYYLRQQLRVIERELGESSEAGSDVQHLRERIARARMPAAAREETQRQLERLVRMHPDSAETATLRNYLEVMTGLPWGKATRDRVDLAVASQVLDADHFGLPRVKERILEFLAVRKLSRRARGPILCFVGPPGVGKTSLGRSIARALGRRFVRMSLGGVRDEAEIRGHRRTYVGAMPGRILQGLQQAGTTNPVFVLDELDKLGADFRGDPGSALLEVLDPEQNHTFRDHFLGVPFDLSRVLFITTANLIDPVQPALRDRMEVVTIEGYTEEEKVVITRQHLLPRLIDEHGLGRAGVRIDDAAVVAVIRGYTREVGLRGLERELAALCRKIARGVAEGVAPRARVTAASVASRLGPPRNQADELLRRDPVGVAIGLAWTAQGGELLFIEASAMAGKGGLTLTGQLGDVMQESARAALTYLRAHAGELGLDPAVVRESDIHVHVPEGAIAKDGPSAGIAIAVALCSALSGRPIDRELAMTGEITLRGDVLAVGGIKQKLLAARRAKVRCVLLPRANESQAPELEPLLGSLELLWVDRVEDVLRRSLRPAPGRAARAMRRRR